MRPRGIVSLWLVLLAGSLFCFSQAAPTKQQQIEAHNRQASEYLKANRPDQAAAEFKAIVALDPHNVDAQGNLGVVLYFQGDYAGAIPQLQAALKLKPALAKIQALLGLAEKRTGDLTAARHDLEAAFPKVQDDKIRIEAGMELIDLESAAGDLDDAATTVSALRKAAPTDQTVLYAAYRLYSDLANESLLSLSIVAPNSGRMHQALAHELAKRGKTQEAIDNYREALKADPQLPGLHFELAEMLSALGTTDAKREAKGEYKAALQANPMDEQAECRLGDIALQANDTKTASDAYARAMQLRPDDPEANIGLAKVMMALDQPQKAEALLQHALQLDPTSATAHFRLSTIYRQAGRTADAKHEIEEYQKYKEMKEKLRSVYHDLHREESPDDSDEAHPR
jgi:tetratricopeptide (TPR) repeat protein